MSKVSDHPYVNDIPLLLERCDDVGLFDVILPLMRQDTKLSYAAKPSGLWESTV